MKSSILCFCAYFVESAADVRPVTLKKEKTAKLRCESFSCAAQILRPSKGKEYPNGLAAKRT